MGWRPLVSGAAFTPASLTGLLAWYKADAGVTLSGSNVTQWNDQTSNGYNLTPSTNPPTFSATGFNSKQGITFTNAGTLNLGTGVSVVNFGGTTGSFYVVCNLGSANAQTLVGF